jgi:hypothetical protein
MIGRKPDDSGASLAPFLGALALIVIVVIGIGVVTLVRGDEDSPREAVVRAAIAHNDALQRLDFDAYRQSTCAESVGEENRVFDDQRASVTAKGARYVNDVHDIAIDGDAATATVVYYFESDKDNRIDTPSTFRNEDGTWRLCTLGPR